MQALTFTETRAAVLHHVRAAMRVPEAEAAGLGACSGRVLAEDIAADRDYPPFHRSARDGFAVRAADLPGCLRILGEVRAGQIFSGSVRAGETVEIMTGAPLPEGADAVVMVEHAARNADGTIEIDRRREPGSHVVARGSEVRHGSVVLTRGTRLDYAAIACLASVGCTAVPVFVRPRVAIVSTGDEVVDVADTPGTAQIRNSNAWSLAAQVERAGGIPVILPVASDTREHTRSVIEDALPTDLLLLSGGVSAGKHDVVEPVLADLGATFFFDRVLIQPGQPLVFGSVHNCLFFGLPGNPASTMVTFEVFARLAVELLSGVTHTSLPLTLSLARLTEPFSHKTGLTRFLPAQVCDAQVTPVAWAGSGDIAALCRANAYIVADAGTAHYAAGDLIPVIFK